MSNVKKFLLTVMIGIVALILEFGFHQNQLAFWLIAIVGGVMTISMLIGMIETLRSGKYGVDILAITAIVATLLVGEYWASLMVLIMLTGGDSLEDYASHQASRELRSLLDNSPQTAHRIDGESINDLSVEEVQVGDIILVKPGEVVPVDGRVLSGESFVDESSLTGESKPIEKKINDELMSGSINGDAALRFKVTKAAKDSQYQTLVKLVKESEAKPAHFVRLADRYAVPFTIIAYVIGGVAWFVSKDPVRFAEVLVVASPCPLILAAPVALVAGMSRSSRNGIVVKTGTTIEKLARAKSIAFDKTGTLTGKAVFAAAPVELSNEQTAVYVSINNIYAGYITFTDIVREESAETITSLNRLGIEKTIMLTGDHQSIANKIASEVGISEVHAECLPEEKINVLRTLSEAERPSIMVGDGVNDAPALAIADIGIAMGAHGSTAASESADAVILKDDLTRVSEAVRLSQDTMRIARQSVLIGIVICVVLMLIASTGVIPALLGAALQEVIDTVSILSALRARKDH